METPECITNKTVRTKLTASLMELLASEGFILKKKDNRILRKTNSGYESFSFTLLNYWPYCSEVERVYFHVRFDAVEEIIAPIAIEYLGASTEFVKQSITKWDEVEFRHKVFKEEDVDNFITAHMAGIKEAGMSFFAEFGDINTANAHYKNTILNSADGIGNDWFTLSRSVTLMRLCDDADFEHLKTRYREIMRPRFGEEQETFAAYDGLVAYLLNR